MVYNTPKSGLRVLVLLFSVLAVVMLSAYASATAPAPANLKVSIIHNDVVLTWDPVTNATGYNVYRSTDNSTYTLLATVNDTHYTDTTLNASGTYYYKVASVDADGEGLASYVVVKFYPPSTPQNLAVKVGLGQVTLTWDAVPNATGYYVYRGTSQGNESVLIFVTGTSYEDSDVVGGNMYFYYVTAYNSTGESAPSIEVQASVSAGSGVVELRNTTWNSYLLATAIILLLVSLPVMFYGKRSHRDVAAFGMFLGLLALVSSYFLDRAGYATQIITIAGYKMSTILTILGIGAVIVGIIIVLMTRAGPVRGKMRNHVDVGVFSIAFGLVALGLSYLLVHVL